MEKAGKNRAATSAVVARPDDVDRQHCLASQRLFPSEMEILITHAKGANGPTARHLAIAVAIDSASDAQHVLDPAP
jgi:hypothetical protein